MDRLADAHFLSYEVIFVCWLSHSQIELIVINILSECYCNEISSEDTFKDLSNINRVGFCCVG